MELSMHEGMPAQAAGEAAAASEHTVCAQFEYYESPRQWYVPRFCSLPRLSPPAHLGD
jgi:hypothetical protein